MKIEYRERENQISLLIRISKEREEKDMMKYYNKKELEEMRIEEMKKGFISIEIFGNKKDFRLENGILYISENKEKEFEEMGMIQKEKKEMEISKNGKKEKEMREYKYILDGENKIPYRIDNEKGKEEYQFHQKRKSSYKISSQKDDDGNNIRMILFPKEKFNRIEIWRFPKGEKREMIYRNDKMEYNEILEKWMEIGGDEIDIKEEIEKIG